MTDPVSQTAPAADQLLLPLFYKSVQPLHGAAHASWRLKDGDAGFAADTPFVPIVASELAAAARDYPVVFAADSAQPLAILGLERRNLFVEDGRWSAAAYVPAYVRRYPSPSSRPSTRTGSRWRSTPVRSASCKRAKTATTKARRCSRMARRVR
jgi:hypothetical protein